MLNCNGNCHLHDKVDTMAAYDPRMYQNYGAMLHPSILSSMGHQAHQRTQLAPPATLTPHQTSTFPLKDPHAPARPPRESSAEMKPKDMPRATSPWKNTYRTAQSIAFPETVSSCGERVAGFLEDLARSIGCPVEYVLLPLLPCVGGLLGTNTSIRVHRGWSEPPILWSIVCANPGTRRSAVIRQLLSPILTLQTKRAQNSAAKISASSENGNPTPTVNGVDAVSGTNKVTGAAVNHKRALYSGTRINAAALTEVLHRNDGHAFSLTENVENLHEMLGLLQQTVPPRLVSVMEDLYEGLPLVAVEDGRVTTILGSNFCYGGFASPEYGVTMMLKCPSWLSTRLLVACPQTDDMKGVFGEPGADVTQPDLGVVYETILTHHEQERVYTFSSEAIQELSKYFDDDWSTVLNQLDQTYHEGIIGKSMGQIVRICAVLKALDNSVKLSQSSDTEWDWTIGTDTVVCAITLGKYFLEQKLAMTFMVNTGFFSAASMDVTMNGNENNAQSGESASSKDKSSNSAPSASSDQQPPHSSVTASAHVSAAGVDSFPGQAETSHNLPSAGGGWGVPPKSMGQSGDIDYSNLPQTMTTLEEDVSEMMQAVDFVHFSTTQFVAVHGRRIKRLLECYDDAHGVSATTAAQKSITPPVRIEGTNNRHPAWASALFFQKVAELQLGMAEQGRHPTNKKVCWRFKRKPVSQLTEKNIQLLQYLRVDMDKYSQFGSGNIMNPGMMVNCGLVSGNNVPGLPGLDDDSKSPNGSVMGDIKHEPPM